MEDKLRSQSSLLTPPLSGSETPQIDWHKLVSDLLGISVDPKSIKVQVYFKDRLQKIIEHVNENIYA